MNGQFRRPARVPGSGTTVAGLRAVFPGWTVTEADGHVLAFRPGGYAVDGPGSLIRGAGWRMVHPVVLLKRPRPELAQEGSSDDATRQGFLSCSGTGTCGGTAAIQSGRSSIVRTRVPHFGLATRSRCGGGSLRYRWMARIWASRLRRSRSVPAVTARVPPAAWILATSSSVGDTGAGTGAGGFAATGPGAGTVL